MSLKDQNQALIHLQKEANTALTDADAALIQAAREASQLQQY